MLSVSTTSAAPSCRILTVCSSASLAQRFVQRLISFAAHADKSPEDPTAQNIVPWTIINKYYTADVHFEIKPIAEWSVNHIKGVPAVIFVWEQGESYKEHIERLSKDLASHDSDVALAVKLNSQTRITQEEEEGEGTDEFLSSRGFEYIDGNNESDRRALEDDDNAGTPGLARVVDALSTIMWPSMVQSAPANNRKSRARELLDWAREEEAEDGLRALLQTEAAQEDGLHPSNGSSRRSRMQKEMDELEKWLEEDERKITQQDPWARRGDELSAPNGTDSSRTPLAPTFAFEGGVYSGSHGFEDDFAEFVGAPLTTDDDASSSFLGPPRELASMHTGSSYMSLASDFAGDASRSSDQPDVQANDDSNYLPSHAEIEMTSKRLFGGSSLPAASSAESSVNEHSFDRQDEDDSFEPSAFDLSQVFSALQVMKEEISEIKDDDERRKAAARVALGLVHGLHGNKGIDSDEEVVD